MKESAESQNHRARLCHLKLWPNFSGYGFSLRTDSVKHEHKVENVEPLSPSESGDRLSHTDVVKVIKERSDVEMLVVQPKDLAYFRKFSDVISAAIKDPILCETSEEDLNKLTNAEKHLVKADSDTMNEIYQRQRCLLKANELANRLQRHGGFGDGTVKNGVRTCVNYGYANGVEH
ncbi:putative pdz domain containing protein [Schistosoma mansoni]|uniref:putative pdz domain containing protein n=1 Tax=Schistosoma mansoni TaxID=6183 RepID=UPI00022DC6B6|nr:putative pdz domain containing protein [Schistosoma mansoni]|eukprot:XP_018649500.1 putative pdz domain containing protein [Schistosoma mansoni]